MQLTGQKLGNITDSKNSPRVNPSRTTRPRRWTKEPVQNKQSNRENPFVPLVELAEMCHPGCAAFLGSSIKGGKNVCMALNAGSPCCAIP